jgi:hypothetical protein
MKVSLGFSSWLRWLYLLRHHFAQQCFLMGYFSFSANPAPIWVAKEEGLFKRFDIMPDLIFIGARTK